MKPILFSKTETDFTTNGLGRLECIYCEVTEERNGMYELEMEMPVDSPHANQIEQQSIIGVIPHDGGSVQAFVVYKISKVIRMRFRIYARHLSYRLTDIPCMPFSVALSPSACATTLSTLKANAIESCPFNFYTDVTTAANYTQKIPASIRQRLGGVEGSVLEQFGGEYEWDNWDVHLWKARGRLQNTTGFSLRYGKNITDLDQEEEIANTVTGIVPFWIDTEGNNLVTLTEKAVYSQNASAYPYHLTETLDLSSNFEEKPSEAQIRTTTQAYVNKTGLGVPKVSIKVSFVSLWETEEYKDIAPLERVQLCDEVLIVFEKLGVNAIAKVVKTKWDVLKERYISVELGSIRSTLAQAVTDRDAKIDSVYIDAVARANQAAMNATAWLTTANGYVVAVKNADGSWKELLFMDTNDPATARNGIRINNHGIGFWRYAIDGGNVLDGPYNNAWTIDGNLIADYITTGLLKSTNYSAPTLATAPYAVEGLCLAMLDGTIHSEYFALTELGAYIKGCIEASSGHIGTAVIDSNSLKSENYQAPTQQTTPYAAAGTAIGLNNGSITSTHFVIGADGSAHLKGEIEATSGKIGSATIDNDAVHIGGHLPIYYSYDSGSFTFRPKSYAFVGNTVEVEIYSPMHGSNMTVQIACEYDDGTSGQTINITLTPSNYDVTQTLNIYDPSDSDNYATYTFTITGTSDVAVDILTDVCYMGRGGFRGLFLGKFDGYIESDEGKIAGIKYRNTQVDNTGEFKGDIKLINGNNTLYLKRGNNVMPPDVIRTYMDNGVPKTESAFDNGGTAYENQIEWNSTAPQSTDGEATDVQFVGGTAIQSNSTSGTATSLYYNDTLSGWTKLGFASFGDTPLTAGVSDLETGKFYFQYE